jgi:hypothetical protein
VCLLRLVEWWRVGADYARVCCFFAQFSLINWDNPDLSNWMADATAFSIENGFSELLTGVNRGWVHNKPVEPDTFPSDRKD